jgi:soluble lytic murein transglycosylase-like protein
MSIFDRFKSKTKEKVKDNLDDFNFENDFDDLYSFDAGFNETDDRSPVTQAISSAKESAKYAVSRPEFFERALRSTFTNSPHAEGDSITETLSEVKYAVRNELEEIRKPLAGIFRAAADKTKQHADSETILGKIHQKLAELGREESSSSPKETDEQRVQREADSSVQMMLVDFERNKVKQEKVKEEKEAKIITNQEEQNERRHSTLSAYLRKIKDISQESLNYDLDYTHRYYQKNLELQMRGLIIQKDQHRVLVKSAEEHSALLKAIKKNTSLPDYQKYQASEYIGDFTKRSLIDDVKERLSKSINLTERVKRAIDRSSLGSARELANSVGMAGSMASGMEGGLVKNVAGIVGSEIMDFVSGSVPSKLKDKLNLGPKATERLNFGANLFSNPAAAIGETFRRLTGKDEVTGFGSGVTKFFQNIFDTKNNLDDISLDEINGRPDDGAAFDRRTHLSINEIIPGLLTKIHSENEMMRKMFAAVYPYKTRNIKADPLAYDSVNGEFTTEEAVLGRHRGQIEKRLGNLSITKGRYFREVDSVIDEETRKHYNDDTKRTLAKLAQDSKVYYSEKGIKDSAAYRELNEEQRANFDKFIAGVLANKESSSVFTRASQELRKDFDSHQSRIFKPEQLKDPLFRKALEEAGLIQRTERDGMVQKDLKLSELSNLATSRYLEGKVPDEVFETIKEREAREKAEKEKRLKEGAAGWIRSKLSTASDRVKEKGIKGTAAEYANDAKEAAKEAKEKIAAKKVGEKTVSEHVSSAKKSAAATKNKITSYDTVGDLVDDAAKTSKEKYEEALEKIKQREIAGKTVEERVEGAKGAYESAKASVADRAEALKGKVDALSDKPLFGTTVGNIYTNAKNNVSNRFNNLKGKAKDKATQLKESALAFNIGGASVSEHAENAYEKIANLEIKGKTLEERVTTMVGAVKNRFDTAVDDIRSIPIKNNQMSSVVLQKKEQLVSEFIAHKDTLLNEASTFAKEGRSEKVAEMLETITNLKDKYVGEIKRFAEAHDVEVGEANGGKENEEKPGLLGRLGKTFGSAGIFGNKEKASPAEQQEETSEEPKKKGLFGFMSRDDKPEQVEVVETEEEKELRLSQLAANEEQISSNKTIKELLKELVDRAKGPREGSAEDKLRALSRVGGGSGKENPKAFSGKTSYTGGPLGNLISMVSGAFVGLTKKAFGFAVLPIATMLLKWTVIKPVKLFSRMATNWLLKSAPSAIMRGMLKLPKDMFGLLSKTLKYGFKALNFTASALFRGSMSILGLFSKRAAGNITNFVGGFGKFFSGVKDVLKSRAAGLLRYAGSTIGSVATKLGGLLGGLGSKIAAGANIARTAATVAVASNPIGWGVAAVTAIGTAAWFAYKYFKRRNRKHTPLEEFRCVHYGVRTGEHTKIYRERLLALEAYMEDDRIRFESGGNVSIVPSSVKMNEVYSILKLDTGDAKLLERTNKWFNERFLPIFLQHMKIVNDLKSWTSLEKTSELTDKEVYDYLRDIHIDPEVIDSAVSPFGSLSETHTDSKVVKANAEAIIAVFKQKVEGDGRSQEKAVSETVDKLEMQRRADHAKAAEASSRAISERQAITQSLIDTQRDNAKTPPVSTAIPDRLADPLHMSDKASIIRAGLHSADYMDERLRINADNSSYQNQNTYNTPTDGPKASAEEIFDKAQREAKAAPVKSSVNKEEVMKIIEKGGKAAGMDDKVLKVFAAQESGFNPFAKAKTSSASGLFQFIKATWNEVMGRYGRKYNLHPSTTPFDPLASTLMASEYLKQNMRYISDVRPSSEINIADLYLTHFLGPGGAKVFLRALKNNPHQVAASVMPKAAAANGPVFYKDKNRLHPRSVAEVYEWAGAKMLGHAKAHGINLGKGDPTKPENPQMAHSDIDVERKETAVASIAQPGSGGVAPASTQNASFNTPAQPKEGYDSGFVNTSLTNNSTTTNVSNSQVNNAPTTNTNAVDSYSDGDSFTGYDKGYSVKDTPRPTRSVPQDVRNTEVLANSFKDSFAGGLEPTNEYLAKTLHLQEGMSSTLKDILTEVRATRVALTEAAKLQQEQPQQQQRDTRLLTGTNNGPLDTSFSAVRTANPVVGLRRTNPSMK